MMEKGEDEEMGGKWWELEIEDLENRGGDWGNEEKEKKKWIRN